MNLLEPLEFAFFRRALLAGLLASLACGIVGTLVVVRRIASITGGLSHAAFGGLGLGHLLGFEPMAGATGFALACSLGLGLLSRRIGAALDTLIAMLWSIGMALGIVFISLAPGYAPDLGSYLFGSILFVPPGYLAATALLDLVTLLIVVLLFKELQAAAFDEEFSEVMGLPVRGLFLLQLALVALAVVTLIRTAGVILVIALLTIPAATASHWCRTLGRTMLVASLLGAVCTSTGLFAAYWVSAAFDVALPTGPLIVLLAATLYGASSILRGRRTERIAPRSA
jgi:zinc transport system permease protein